ncbi:hypothetical protein [Evansella cellulosilytica]|uniref:Uncharacterized protein n=1 Tax=Evansella cellulosilytica (strain ATCC 21833 / DSM 2522 / FERM P-1141 / JCM 9156 / N-4) TaxID=649639 RepID=E6TWI6_EVAC2|nr:hypothetical protein [Evansella cellulosilytica]ADU32249.1 hypothetical protein Bcell_4018 [Evansella cellulosilytica DSM 2522]
MGESIFTFLFIAFIALVVLVFLAYDRIKIIQYRLEQQIDQNEKIIALLTKEKESKTTNKDGS